MYIDENEINRQNIFITKFYINYFIVIKIDFILFFFPKNKFNLVNYSSNLFYYCALFLNNFVKINKKLKIKNNKELFSNKLK